MGETMGMVRQRTWWPFTYRSGNLEDMLHFPNTVVGQGYDQHYCPTRRKQKEQYDFFVLDKFKIS